MKGIDFAKTYFCIIYFMPCFFGYTSLNRGQMIYLAVYFAFSLFFVVIMPFRKFIDITYAMLPFLMLTIHYSFSSIMNFSTNNMIIGDVIEILRPIIYFLSFLFSIMIFQPYVRKQGLYYYTGFFEKIVFFASFVEFFKYFDPLKQVFYLYTPSEFGSINYIRLSGFTGFAYSYAWILLICIILNAIKTNGRISFRFFYFSILIFLTGSRTGIFALGMTYFFLFFVLKKIRIRLVLFLISGAAVIYTLYSANLEVAVTSIGHTKKLVLSFLNKKSMDGSLVTRLSQIDDALARFYQSPVYGVASSKQDGARLELFYFHHLGVWGSVGLFLYFVLLFIFVKFMTKTEKEVYWLILMMSFILCFSLVLFDQVRLFNIFYALIALLIINSYYKQKEKRHETPNHFSSLR
ncbi:MAG: O-antigen ligase family protein [Bacteroidales bacterium]|jgi:hypothetical protein|nr:O-antigen ligase family protein [Bacteroidales bacterium]